MVVLYTRPSAAGVFPEKTAHFPRIVAQSRERKEFTMINATNINVVVSGLQRDIKPVQSGRYVIPMYHG